MQLCFTGKGDGVAIDVESVRAGPVSGRYALRTLCAVIGGSDAADDAALLRASLPDIEALFRGGLAADSARPKREECLVT